MTLLLTKTKVKRTEALDNRYEVDIICLDGKQAFETLPLSRLLGVIEQYGIEDKTLGWIKSFLKIWSKVWH